MRVLTEEQYALLQAIAARLCTDVRPSNDDLETALSEEHDARVNAGKEMWELLNEVKGSADIDYGVTTIRLKGGEDASKELMDRVRKSSSVMRPIILDSEEVPDMVRDIELFHQKFGLTYVGRPRALPPELSEFRRKFLKEELDEYKTATHRAEYHVALLQTQLSMPGIYDVYDPDQVAEQLEHALDGLVDLVYVAIGTAYLHGFNFREAWRRVHEANMKKVRAERAVDSTRGSTFDVIKPPGWTAPSHKDLVEDHEHKYG